MRENADREVIQLVKAKNGKERISKSDPEGDNAKMRYLKMLLFNKDTNAFDLFNHYSLPNGAQLAGAQKLQPKKYVGHKIAITQRKNLMDKLNVITSLKAFTGMLYIKTVLKKINI